MKNTNIKIIVFLLGILILMNGGFMIIAGIVSYFSEDKVAKEIIFSGVFTTIFGVVVAFLSKDYSRDIYKRESFIIVTFGWIIMAVFATLPYLATESLNTFSDAIFETISGYTTTGSTVFNDVESLPKGILLWRSFTHWIGGMGIIVLTIAIFPLLGIGGMQLFIAEAPGLNADKLHPRIADTAKRLWLIYIAYTFLETLLLWIAGMSFFDAINHSMSTLSTGGFSTKNTSVGFWNDNPLIQYIIILFMFLGGANFILPYIMMKKGVRGVFQNEEFRWYLFFVATFTIITTAVMVINIKGVPFSAFDTQIPENTWENASRHALFQVLAIITTTGFVTADYTHWTPFLKMVFFSLMFLGASTGSTSGGIKIVRHIIMIKSVLLELKKVFYNNAILVLRHNKQPVHKKVVYHILAFFLIYMLSFMFGALFFGAIPLDFETALGVSISSLGNVGPAFGNVGPLDNFSDFPLLGKWCSMFLMLLGRLEFFTVIILFAPFFWKD